MRNVSFKTFTKIHCIRNPKNQNCGSVTEIEFQNINDKSYTPNWTEEISVIDEILNTTPVTYRSVDLMGEAVSGSFYEEELQRTSQEVVRIKKVIRRDITCGNPPKVWGP